MDIAHELRERVEGEVRFDRYSRILYSTDASIYQIEPIGVVIPKHEGDVAEVIRFASREGIPVLTGDREFERVTDRVEVMWLR